MFRGCFSRKYGKGPGIFWEKTRGQLMQSYQAQTIPIVHEWLQVLPGQLFAQDNALGYSASSMIEDIKDREIEVIFWPPNSLHLNLNEIMWNPSPSIYNNINRTASFTSSFIACSSTCGRKAGAHTASGVVLSVLSRLW